LKPGVHPPEGLSAQAIQSIMAYMQEQGVRFDSI